MHKCVACLTAMAVFVAFAGAHALGEEAESTPKAEAASPKAITAVKPDTKVVEKKPAIVPSSPSVVVAIDHPNDVGDKIDLTWEASPDDDASEKVVAGYKIERSADDGKTWLTIDTVGPLTDSKNLDQRAKKYEDSKQIRRDKSYRYRITSIGPGGQSTPALSTAVVNATLQPFDWTKIWFGLLFAALLSLVVIAFIVAARRGWQMKVRKIAGLEVVDEAVGRGTEMGRSCLFVPGINDLNDIQTVAAITVLARITKTAAEYDARVETPTSKSLVMTAARDAVQSAYLTAGRPDAYKEDDIYYVTDEQFGYVAFLAGKMVREKPAACFYMGAFFAESLVLAETGNSIGAIQVAGTAEPSQLPFFVAACDYTLLGEEFFAASAYLSGEPDQLGSLKGQDVGKLVAVALILIGTFMATMVSTSDGKDSWVKSLRFFKKDVLNAGGGE